MEIPCGWEKNEASHGNRKGNNVTGNGNAPCGVQTLRTQDTSAPVPKCLLDTSALVYKNNLEFEN